MTVDWFPLWLSLRVAAVATLLALPAGLWLAGWRARGGQGWRTLAAAPPTVLLGWTALALAGEGRLVANWVAAVGAGICEAVPLLALLGRAALESAGRDCERAARSLGASGWRVFWQVSLPLARWRLLGAVAVVFGRVLGDFGLTLIVAGFAVGRGGVLDATLRQAVESAGGGAARMLVVVISLALVAGVALAERLRPGRVTP